MQAKLAIVSDQPATASGSAAALAASLAARCRTFGLSVELVWRPGPETATNAHTLPPLPEADAYWHVGLTAGGADTVMQASQRGRPVVIHAIGPELEASVTAWQTWPAVQVALSQATRVVAASPRAQRLLTPWHAHAVHLIPLLPDPPAPILDGDRQALRQSLGLRPEGLLIGVADLPAAERMEMLLTTFAEFWDTRQDAWLVLADHGSTPAIAREIDRWARQDYQPARRLIVWQPKSGQSTRQLITACDQLWCLTADDGPSLAMLTALQAEIPVVIATDSGQDPIHGGRAGDFLTDSPPSCTIAQDGAALVFAALAHAADPAQAKARIRAVAAALPEVYREDGLMTSLRASLTDLGFPLR